LYLIGTTDIAESGDPGQVRISAAEVAYLCAETAQLFDTSTGLDICYTQTGVRPLPVTNARIPGAITRRHAIVASEAADGFFSVVGGKLTTHRALAEDALNVLRSRLDIGRSNPSRGRRLPGHVPHGERAEFQRQLAAQVGSIQGNRLFHLYGRAAERIAAIIVSEPELGAPVTPSGPLFTAELVHGLEREWADTLVDLLQRRTMVGLGPDFGFDSAQAAATRLRQLGIWDATRVEEELTAYRRYARRFAVSGGGV
jgi:glycerol-3-phosphate dehydrogenase